VPTTVCGDLIDVNKSFTPESSPTATLAKRHITIIIIIIIACSK
jgi:hypothetical protein